MGARKMHQHLVIASITLAGGLLFSGCGTAPTNLRGSAPMRPPAPVSRSAPTALILAEPDFAPNFGDPLWQGWIGDGPRLGALARAVNDAKRLGTVNAIAGLQDSFWPLVQLGYRSGRVVPLTLDAGNTAAIGLPDGRWQLLKSRFLVRVLRDPRSTFSNTPRSRVTSAPHGRLAVNLGNLPGTRALLYASPPGGSLGKETAPAGSVLLARIPVVNGQIHWEGTVRLPQGDMAQHGWRLTIIVRPFPHFPLVSGESLGLSWPLLSSH